MSRFLSFSLLALLCTAVHAVEPTLDIVFDKPKSLSVAGENISIDGEFTPDGYLKYGKKGIRIPAKGLLGGKGTVIVDFRVEKPQREFGRARNFVTLRNKGRLLASIYTNRATRFANSGIAMSKDEFLAAACR